MSNVTAVLIAAAVTLTAASAGDARPPTKAAASRAIPFELYRGRIYVAAFVDGKGPYRFGFDTGASGMGRADVRLVAEQSLARVGSNLNSDGVKVAPIDVVAVKSLRVGRIEKHNVELLSRDYNRNAKPGQPLMLGIIGADFFADHLLTIDYRARTIRLTRDRLKPKARSVIAYSGRFHIPVCFAKRCTTGQIDTGSNLSIVIPKQLVGEISATRPILVGTGERANSVSKMYEMQLTEPMRIGSLTLQNVKVRYADPSDDVINIGSDFLKDYVLTIDSRNKLLRIE